jgi:hypothetical protein
MAAAPTVLQDVDMPKTLRERLKTYKTEWQHAQQHKVLAANCLVSSEIIVYSIINSVTTVIID